MATKEKTRKAVKLKKVSSCKLTASRKKSEVEKDLAKTYNDYKTFEGKQYSGMKIGRSHKWYYDKGEWKER